MGAGAWGSALACIAARAGHEVILWGRSERSIEEINSSQTNTKYLGALKLETGIRATHEIAHALAQVDLVLCAVPVQSTVGLLPEIKTYLREGATIICCSKGIDQGAGKSPAALLQEALPKVQVGALSGPSFAHDVVQNLPTAVTLAMPDMVQSNSLSQALSAGNFRVYASSDVKGVELGGALKNILAIAVGAARGMGLGASAEAALIARGFAEITRLSQSLGAEPLTLSGLSGLGDLVLSCSSPQSRNFSYGLAIGKNDPLDGLPLAEGAFTAKIAHQLAVEKSVDVPIIASVVDVLEKRVTAREAVGRLLMRPLKSET